VHHRLSNPPHRRRLEIRARGIESTRGFDQTEIALVDQIEQRNAETPKTLRVANDHEQVRLHETPQRHLITMLVNQTAKLLLVVSSE
jgi:hypothetical protein